ncbi:MAG: hypothetical protein JWP25_1588 [Bradyrhizobium sp.]|jgi:hypothetical protein|nr:hypothetical protein [Bradyrhizobium sp.]
MIEEDPGSWEGRPWHRELRGGPKVWQQARLEASWGSARSMRLRDAGNHLAPDASAQVEKPSILYAPPVSLPDQFGHFVLISTSGS